jgi:hypothetical protein
MNTAKSLARRVDGVISSVLVTGLGYRQDPGIALLKEIRDELLRVEELPACTGHVADEPARYDSLIRRYGENPIGIVAELAKKNQERKLMHEMLTAYGIAGTTSEDRELCLVARLAILLEDFASPLDIPPDDTTSFSSPGPGGSHG